MISPSPERFGIASKPRRRRLLSRLLGTARYLVSLGLLIWIYGKHRAPIGAVFAHQPDLRFLALAFCLCLSGLTLTFLRWFTVVRAQRLDLGLIDAIRVGFCGNALDLFIPGQIGGDLYKANYLCRIQPHRTRALASILVDRLIGILGLFTLAAVMGGINWAYSTSEVKRLILIIWGSWLLGVCGLQAILTPTLFRILGSFIRHQPRLRKIHGDLHIMSSIYAARQWAILFGLAMATFSHLLYALSFTAVARAILPDPPSIAHHLLMVPLILFSTVVPLPFGAIGLSERISEDLFSLLGYSMGSLAMLAFRVVSLAVGAISIGFYLFGDRASTRTESNPSPPTKQADQASSRNQEASG